MKLTICSFLINTCFCYIFSNYEFLRSVRQCVFSVTIMKNVWNVEVPYKKIYQIYAYKISWKQSLKNKGYNSKYNYNSDRLLRRKSL